MSKLVKSTVWLSIILLLSKFMGFIKDLVLAYKYGTTNISDIYMISYTIPTIIIGGVVSCIITSYIPIYNEIKKNNEKEYINKYTSNLINIMLIIGIFICSIFYIYPESIVKIFSIGFDGKNLQYCIQMTKITILSIPFMGIIYILQGYLQVNNKFKLTGLMGLILNFIIILGILVVKKENFVYLSYFTLLGYIICAIIFYIEAKNNKLRYIFNIDIKDRYLKDTIKIIVPIFIGAMVREINNTIDKSLASTLKVGSISSLNYSSKVCGAIQTICITPIVTTIFPKISEQAIESEDSKLIFIIKQCMKIMIIIVTPLVFTIITFSEQIVIILFGRGEFDSTSIIMTSIPLKIYSITILTFGLRDILNRIYYSMKDSKTPMINGIITIILNIVLNIIFIKPLGHTGLALATSISSIITVLLLIKSLNRKIKDFSVNDIIIYLIKSSILSLLTCISMYLIYINIKLHMIISFIISGVIGIIIYIFGCILFKIEEVVYIIQNIKKYKVLSK